METMLNMIKISVIVSCVVLLLILLKPVLNRRYHAKWKYYVWLCLAVALLFPLSPAGGKLSEATQSRAPVQITVPDIDRTFGDETLGVTAPAMPMVPPVSMEQTDNAVGQADTVQTQTATAAGKARSVEEVIMLVWLMGMAGFAAYYGVGTAVFYRRAVRWSRKAEEEVTVQAERLMAEMKIRRKIPVLVSESVTSPMMIGFVRPRLLLSEGAYSAQDLDFILRHELTHYKRRDLWYKLLLLCANCVHWFNPFAWLLVREAAIDMELSCDDAVVAGGDETVRRAYSETLLASLHRQSGMNVALSTFFYGGKETMKERFRNIMGLGRRRKGVLALCIVLSVTIAAACLIGCQVAGNEEEPGTALTESELAQWQGKLESTEYNGFVTHMYSEAKYIRLNDVLYTGAQIEHEPDETEVRAYLDAVGGEELYTDLVAIYAEDLEEYLHQHIGLALDEFEAPLEWVYVEAYDSYYLQRGDTNYAVVEVVSGMQTGDTVTLEIADKSGATMGGTLTIVDDKIVSYTNSVYSAAEAMALTEVQELYTDGVTERVWLQSLYPGQSVAGESGTYQEWWVTLGMQYVENAPVVDPGIDGRVNYAGTILVRVETDGTVTFLESGFAEGWDAPNTYRMLDLSFEEYIRYHYEMEIALTARRQGWPTYNGQLIYAIHAGGKGWTQAPESVAEGWCLSMGDELAEYTMLDSWESSADMARMDLLVQVVTKQGRTVRLLLSHVLSDFHDVAYWEVLGHKLVSGSDLPEHRVGEDTRPEFATLTRTLEGVEESVPVYLYTGGEVYGIGEWSMYIPYENWSCNYLTDRWCPNPDDMTTYIQVVRYGGHYSFEQFYDSYERQFDQVWTNEDQIKLGANVAHAVGYQETAGGRYCESNLYKGDGCWYEVMWTYAAEAAEGWGARLSWTAATFGIIGDNTAYEMGELRSTTDDRPNAYLQEEDTPDRPAGTYLLFPKSGNTFRLEQYVGVEKGVVDFVGITTFLNADGTGTLVYSARIDGKDVYLGVAHDSAVVTNTVVVGKDEIDAPDNHVLGGMIRGMLEGTTSSMPLVVRNTGGSYLVDSGLYLVLPENNQAFHLKDYFETYAEGIRAERQRVAPKDGYGDIHYDGFDWVYTYPEENGKELLVFLTDWSIAIENEQPTSLAGGMYVENGRWYWGYPVYLIVEHNGDYVTRTFVMMENDCFPGDETFTNDLNNRLANPSGITVHSTHPAIYYDSATGKLVAMHTSPNQSA